MGNFLENLFNNNNDKKLVKPGDNMTARITPTNRGVVKLSKENGNYKYSETYYPTTNRVVRTESKKINRSEE